MDDDDNWGEGGPGAPREELGFIFRRCLVDITSGNIRSFLNRMTIGRDDPILGDLLTKGFKNSEDDERVSCVALFVHPMDDITVDNSRVYVILCLNVGFTCLYRKKHDKQKGDVKYRIAEQDSYDFDSGKYDEARFAEMRFFTESACNAKVNGMSPADRNRVYNNDHNVMNEFVKNCSNGNSTDGRPIISHDVIRLDLLKNDYHRYGGESRFTSNVDREMIYVGKPQDLPLVRGAEPPVSLDEVLKVMCFDIETVNVDRHNKPCDDVIIIISITNYEGNKFHDAACLSLGGYGDADGDNMDVPLNETYARHGCGSVLPVVRRVYETEADMLKGFVKEWKKFKPHILTHYNGAGFDLRFMGRGFFLQLKQNIANYLTFFDNRRVRYGMNSFGNARRKLEERRSGLIPDEVLTVQHDEFSAFVSVDAMWVNMGRLDDAAHKFLGVGKLDVPYTQIARMYYGEDRKLIEYAMIDALLVSLLFNRPNRFDLFNLYLESQNDNGCPWNLAISGKKSVMATATIYNEMSRAKFAVPHKNKPKAVNSKTVMKEVISHLLRGGPVPSSSCRQVVRDYLAGNCKTKTYVTRFNKFRGKNKGCGGCGRKKDTGCKNKRVNNNNAQRGNLCVLSYPVLCKLVKDFVECIPSTRQVFTTTHLMTLIQYITVNMAVPADLTPLSRLLGLKIPLHLRPLAEGFFRYVVEFRRPATLLSPWEDMDILFDTYDSFYNYGPPATAELKVAILKAMGGGGGEEGGATTHLLTPEIRRDIVACRFVPARPEPHVDLMGILCAHVTKFELDMLSFDGAYIVDPMVGIDVDFPVCCLDFSSQYPNAILACNMGVETQVSRSTVAGRVEGVDYVCSNVRRTDDEVHHSRYLELGMTHYVDENYIFFVHESVSTSVSGGNYQMMLNSRLEDKKQMKKWDNSTTAEGRRNYVKFENRSTTKKIKINSHYGLLGTIMKPEFLPAVTATARRAIKFSYRLLVEDYAVRIILRYGDTDSIMVSFDRGCFDICRMGEEERTAYFGLTECPEVARLVTDILARVGESEHDRGTAVVHAVFEKHVVPRLNAASNRYMTLECEKTMLPFVLPARKKYVALIRAHGKWLVKGLSLNNKKSIVSSRNILTSFQENIRLHDRLDLVALYHYVGTQVFLPVLEGTISRDVVSRNVSIDTTKLKPGTKNTNLIKRLTEMGETSNFEKLKLTVLTVEPLSADDEDWSLVPVNYRGKMQLHVSKIMSDSLSEILAILATQYPPTIMILFDLFVSSIYDRNLSAEDVEYLLKRGGTDAPVLKFDSIPLKQAHARGNAVLKHQKRVFVNGNRLSFPQIIVKLIKTKTYTKNKNKVCKRVCIPDIRNFFAPTVAKKRKI